MLTMRTSTWLAVGIGFASVVMKLVTAAPPVPPVAYSVWSVLSGTVKLIVATVTLVSAVRFNTSERVPLRIAE